MINYRYARKYCLEDLSVIENYQEAISSNEKYDLHHKFEIELNKSSQELRDLGLYYNRPASELIFLPQKEHKKLHCKNLREETRKKISESNKGKHYALGYHHTEETKKRISEAMKNREISNETRNKISTAKKGKRMSEESIRKMSESKKGKITWNKGIPCRGETKKKLSEYFKNTIWIHNDISSKMIKPEELDTYISQGFTLGRIKWRKAN